MRRVARTHAHRSRRGAALVDVLIGGILLGIGLAAVVSLTGRSLRTQTDGEKQLVAAWLADEQLAMVLVEGPADYAKVYSTSGRCAAPFEEFEYDLSIQDIGIGEPFRVTATVSWPSGRSKRFVQVQTLIADRGDDRLAPRIPFEPVDRMTRWYELDNK